MDKYIALDIGNVLVHFDVQNMVQELSKFVTGYSEEVKKEVALSTLERVQASHDLGLLNFKHAMEEFLIRQDKSMTLESRQLSNGADELVNYWNNIVKLDVRIIKFIKKLKENNVKIALLSNMGKEHYQYLKKIFPELFKDSIEFISFQVGARKPTKLYYHLFVEEYPEFRHCLYLDDIQENIEASSKYLNPFSFNLEKLCESKKIDKTLKLILDKYISE